ncbi:hypothetical protein QQF64_019620 [Cirrhinus molitorella]|uniref:Uncharacterized protein n=1 Tax=Cirrhinus molitorella TaxID=172907 RepID=A0ABR3LFZ6_9TELE
MTRAMCEILPRSRCLNPHRPASQTEDSKSAVTNQICISSAFHCQRLLSCVFTPFIFTIVHFINRIMIFLIFLTVHKGVILIGSSSPGQTERSLFPQPRADHDQFICSLSEERGKDSPSEMSLSQKQSVRSGSHVSSSVSVKSDWSKDDPPDFSEEPSQTKRLQDKTLDPDLQSHRKHKNLIKQSDSLLQIFQWSALAFVLLTSEEELEEFELQKFKKSDECVIRLSAVIRISKRAL